MSVRQGWGAILLTGALSLLCPGAALVARAQDAERALEGQISSKIQTGQIDSALDQAHRAVAKFPRSSALYQMLGAALFKKGLNDDARAAFRRAIELDRNLPENYFNLALVELSESRYAEAVPPLEACLRLDPANAQARVLLGRAYHNLNQTLPAIEQFKKAVELSPRLPLAHYHLGYAYQSQGNLQGALTEFRKEIELNSSFYEAYWLAGNIELAQGNLDAAEALYLKGINLQVPAFQAHLGLARVLLERRHFAAAEAELKKVLESRPDDAETHYALARLYRQTGRKQEAQREYQFVAALRARSRSQASATAYTKP